MAKTCEGSCPKPNIVVLLADDVGLMDFGAYGGEAKTPNIDALAQRGAFFTQHRSSPQCAPSRAMLLTGMDNHRAGLGAIPEVLPPSHAGKPGYTMHLEDGVQTLATRLQAEGYRTFMTGKWHLGHGPGDLPNGHGFDRSYALDASGADNFADRPYMPLYTEAPWFEDGEPVTLPEDFYSSEFLVDRMIDYIGPSSDPAAPFLAYVAFQAIHIPVQAPAEFITRYDGVYDAGWQAVREQRYERAQRLGLIAAGARLGPMHPGLRVFDDLEAGERARVVRSMQANAGMLEAMDFHIGRLIDHLRSIGAYDNTIFVVTSDNGPEGGDPLGGPAAQSALMKLWLWSTGYRDWSVEALGGPGTFVAIGPGWASAAASPSHLFKFHGADGALRVPLIMAGAGIPENHRVDQLTLMSDVMPTLLALVDARDAPVTARPMTGRSLVPALRDPVVGPYGETEAVGIEVAGNVALYRGRHKLVRNLPPYGDGSWHVHDWWLDPGETQDLASPEPQLLTTMLTAYDGWATDMGVIAMAPDYTPIAQIGKNLSRAMLRNYWPLALALLLVLGAVVILGLRIVLRFVLRTA
ncbi:MAG: sulfatase-like hydrolase/transferase [Pseudomonadota bacterium]